MGRIDTARWDLLSPLLDELLGLEDGARAERLARLRSEDSALADDVESLLSQQPAIESSSFLEHEVPRPAREPTLAGQIVGNYTLERVLGQGGMGSVWLAHRSDGRYQAHVAVKLLNLALLGASGVDRFQREGHALARLTHPNIARLVDAGVTPTGQPYLVLDHVAGEPITRWANNRSLNTRARVRLFLQVLAAVAHAHEKLLLHRDLKPSNILVTPDGQVKLLDFGIAKLLDDEARSEPMTQLTGLAGPFTPEFAAPEQIQAGEVSTATDVYALGVLLYLLLTGRHPTMSEQHTPIDRLRAVVDTNPTPPSEAAAQAASAPSFDSAPFVHNARALRGDLDNIVLKALKKSPTERYRTVEAFAADLDHYLNHQPVTARADSLSYRATKFLIRHSVAAAAAAIVLATIVGAAVISFHQAREATRQRDRALSLAARNEAVVDFVGGMLTEVAPADQPVRVADLLDRSQSILMSGASNPEHQAAILSLLSSYYLGSGKPGQADALLSRSLALTKSTPDAALRAVLLCDSAFAASLLGRPADSDEAMNQGLQLASADPLASMRCLRNRAFIAQNANDPAAALEFTLRAQTRLRDANVSRPETEAEILADIGYAHYLSGRTVAAYHYYDASLKKLAEIGRNDSPRVFTIRNNWGIASFAAGDYRRALEQYDEALRVATRHSVGGEPPPYLLANRALALSALARYPEALAAYDQAIASSERAGNSTSRLTNLANRTGTYVLMGDIDRAERELAALVPEVGKSIAPDSVPGMSIMYVRARIAAARGRTADALAGYSNVIEFFDSRGMAVAPVSRTLNARAEVHLETGDVAAALADGERSLRIARAVQGDSPQSSQTGLAYSLLARVHERRGELAEARSAANHAIEHLQITLGVQHPETTRARQILQRLAATTGPQLLR
jgi:eukaryotic-like serine/threonine-protein kinase